MTFHSQKKSFSSIGSFVWNVRKFQFSDANKNGRNPIKWISEVCTFARFDRWWPKLFFCEWNTTKFTRFQGIYRSSALLRDLAWHLLLDERCQFACSKQGFSMRLELEMDLNVYMADDFLLSNVVSNGLEPNYFLYFLSTQHSNHWENHPLQLLRLTQHKRRLRISWTSEHPSVCL